MAYLTIELKTNNDGGTAAEVKYSGIDIRMAEKTHYAALSDAALLTRPAHAVVILDELGQQIASMGYKKEESQNDV